MHARLDDFSFHLKYLEAAVGYLLLEVFVAEMLQACIDGTSTVKQYIASRVVFTNNRASDVHEQ